MATPFASPSVEPGKVVVTVPFVPKVASSVPSGKTRVTDHTALLTPVSLAATILPSDCNAISGKLEDHWTTNGTVQYPPAPNVESRPTMVELPSFAAAEICTIWLPS